mmetsp:Transcript_31259/g.93294  ORF Transcript_31259/g.93294 Transcript_31259/m.93294 type:complete len:129 (+) Transcript_31259:468-854(+)
MPPAARRCRSGTWAAGAGGDGEEMLPGARDDGGVDSGGGAPVRHAAYIEEEPCDGSAVSSRSLPRFLGKPPDAGAAAPARDPFVEAALRVQDLVRGVGCVARAAIRLPLLPTQLVVHMAWNLEGKRLG